MVLCNNSTRLVEITPEGVIIPMSSFPTLGSFCSMELCNPKEELRGNRREVGGTYCLPHNILLGLHNRGANKKNKIKPEFPP